MWIVSRLYIVVPVIFQMPFPVYDLYQNCSVYDYRFDNTCLWLRKVKLKLCIQVKVVVSYSAMIIMSLQRGYKWELMWPFPLWLIAFYVTLLHSSFVDVVALLFYDKILWKQIYDMLKRVAIIHIFLCAIC